MRMKKKMRNPKEDILWKFSKNVFENFIIVEKQKRIF